MRVCMCMRRKYMCMYVYEKDMDVYHVCVCASEGCVCMCIKRMYMCMYVYQENINVYEKHIHMCQEDFHVYVCV